MHFDRYSSRRGEERRGRGGECVGKRGKKHQRTGSKVEGVCFSSRLNLLASVVNCKQKQVG